MSPDETVVLDAVEGRSETERGLVCRVGDRPVQIPPRFLLAGSEVRRPGDRGRLVIPRWLAADLGLVQ